MIRRHSWADRLSKAIEGRGSADRLNRKCDSSTKEVTTFWSAVDPHTHVEGNFSGWNANRNNLRDGRNTGAALSCSTMWFVLIPWLGVRRSCTTAAGGSTPWNQQQAFLFGLRLFLGTLYSCTHEWKECRSWNWNCRGNVWTSAKGFPACLQKLLGFSGGWKHKIRPEKTLLVGGFTQEVSVSAYLSECGNSGLLLTLFIWSISGVKSPWS